MVSHVKVLALYVPAVIPEPVHTATVDETIDDTTKAWFMATLADVPTCPEIVTVSPTVNVVVAAKKTVVDVADEAMLCVTEAVLGAVRVGETTTYFKTSGRTVMLVPLAAEWGTMPALISATDGTTGTSARSFATKTNTAAVERPAIAAAAMVTESPTW